VLLFGFDALTFLVSLACILAISHRWDLRGGEALAFRSGAIWRRAASCAAGPAPSVPLILFSVDNFFIMGPAEVGLGFSFATAWGWEANPTL
jgi:hypothetical protein